MSRSTVTPEQKENQKGHRARQRRKLLELGAERMSDKEILEMLLFYALPRVDTKPIANELLQRFGSLKSILCADPVKLRELSGIKENAEVLFMLLRETARRFEEKAVTGCFFDFEVASEYLKTLFLGADRELVYVLFLDKNGYLLEKQLLFTGSVSSAKLSLRPVTEGAIRAESSHVILAHNHPSGSCIPSTDDIYTTNQVGAHLSANEITLVEHYIVTKTHVSGILKA